tara:strand:- start:32 stop:133 length:102 start_codon:yes stop_codon:yes gene_type:complete
MKATRLVIQSGPLSILESSQQETLKSFNDFLDD